MEHLDFSLYLKFFIGLVAIINPLGLLPVFVIASSPVPFASPFAFQTR